MTPGATPAGPIDAQTPNVYAAMGRGFGAEMGRLSDMTPEAMQQMLEQDMKTWADVVKATGVKQ